MKQRVANRFLSSMDFDDGGDRFLKAVQRFMEMAEENAVEVEVGQNGELKVAEPREATTSPKDVNHGTQTKNGA
jgi:hypothetical protein